MAEQRLINSVGGIDSGNLLNAVNPIGSARQGLLSNPGFGSISNIGVPNLLGTTAGGVLGATAGVLHNK
ncbi:hypothetical protein [Allochromatium vinosum]|uniref:hypothetical protein n=1 Tax=Allochromatium vinosum TaxID=1049 RepID=UPI001903174C|nr:hypothetical protein [Allochromatium vinosum]